MKKENQKELLTKILDLLENHFGNSCEIVLHDLTLDYEHTIVDIRNGTITGRKVGDCGSNLGLEVLRGTVIDGDRYNYITHTKDAKILRSSSMYIHDGEKVIGSICLNSDITDAVKYEHYLHNLNNYSLDDTGPKEVFANDVMQLWNHFLTEGQKLIGKPANMMNKEDKLSFLEYLDKNGAFLISKSGEKICEFLNISKYTLYSYLDILRSKNGKGAQINKDEEGEGNK